MIKIKANLLKFGVIDKIGVTFPKDCKIDIPEVIPITYPNNNNTIGKTTSIKRDDEYIKIEGVIDRFNPQLEDAVKTLAESKDLYVGGYYQIIKEHCDKDGTRVINSMRLVSVGLYVDDVYGNKVTSLEVVE